MSKSNNLYNPLKKAMDKLIAFVLFIMLLPLFSIILLSIFINGIIKHQDKGSVIYRERRYSQGKCFYILKFRVLRMEIIEKAHSMGQHAKIYEKDISNLTLVGRYLKKWYLDELPQLINIFVGDMSLVGPRPWVEEYFKAQLNRGIDYRNYTMAGWTGPGQLCKNITSSKNVTSLSEAADIEYVSKLRTLNPFSLFLTDLNIIFRTFQTMLRGKGLYD